MASSNSSSSSAQQHEWLYPYPSTINVSNFVSIKLSTNFKKTFDNYLPWKTQILGLVESQDLLGFIDGTNPAPAEMITVCDSMQEIQNPKYMLWKRSDRLVKGWILGSLNASVVNIVVGLITARDVWIELQNKFDRDSQEKPSTKQDDSDDEFSDEEFSDDDDFEFSDESKKDQAEEKDVGWYLPLLKAALRGDWNSAKKFFDQDEAAITAKITVNLDTALHVAVGSGKSIHFVEKLVELMPTEALALQNNAGHSALTVAAIVGNTKAAVILVKKTPALLYIKDSKGNLPVHWAAYSDKRDTLLYLLSVTKDEIKQSPFDDQIGGRLLIAVIMSGFLDMALDLVQQYPSLATMKDNNGDTPLIAISRKASAFPSGTCLNYWERLIYSFVPVELKNNPNNPNRGDVENPMCGWVGSLGGNYSNIVYKKLHAGIWGVAGLLVPSIKRIQDKRLTHHQALLLVKCLCEEIKSLNDQKSYSFHFGVPVSGAAALGIHEIVEEIVDAFPDAVWYGGAKSSIFHVAVINRCEKVFNLIFQMSEYKHYLTSFPEISRNNIMQLPGKPMPVPQLKSHPMPMPIPVPQLKSHPMPMPMPVPQLNSHPMPSFPDITGNNILHLAGKLAPLHKLNIVSCPALQIQRELQWFKEVEKFVTPVFKERTNIYKETPEMVFTKEHKNLVQEGEKWMKDTSHACTRVAAFIAIVVFAAAIIVPIGSKGESGLPIFSKENTFIIFAISDAISLFTSMTSMLMFMSILSSCYAAGDFLHVLPRKIIIGLVMLFLAVTSMVIAFSATFYLVFGQRRAWILIPVSTFACLPVISFGFSQFPLLVNVISSTYGPGIFKKQSDRPLY